MTGTHEKATYREKGAVSIVEATFVFPIMFIILLFLIYMGNAYFLKAQVAAASQAYALKGAAYCADPMLESIKDSGSVPSLSNLHVKPYRYVAGLFGSDMDGVESKISTEAANAVSNAATFFFNMKPQVTNKNSIAKYNNHVLYSTFSVNIECKVPFPISFLGSSTPYVLRFTSYSEVAVNDTGEFIRNTDMVIDYFEKAFPNAAGKVKDVFGKVNDFLSSFAGK